MSPFVNIPAGQRQLMVVCVFLYAILLVSLALIIPGSSSGRFMVLGSSLLFIGVVAVPIIFPPKVDGYLHPLVLTSSLALVNIAIAKTALLATGLDYHSGLRGWPESDLLTLVTYVNFVGSIAYISKYAGFRFAGRSSITAVRFNNRPNSLFLPLLFFWGMIGIGAMIVIVQGSGGISAHLANMNRGMTSRVYVANQQLLGAASFVVQSTIAIPILFAAFRKKGHKSPIFFLMVIATASMCYLTAGRRGALLTPMVFGIGIWIYNEKKFPLFRALAIGAALFMSIGVGRIWRNSNRSLEQGINWNFLQDFTVADLAERSMEELSDRMGNSDPIYPIAAKVPKQIPFTYGLNYFENLYRFIPRVFWPGKPDGIGIKCSEVFYHRYEQGGIPPGPLGEAYWSLHIPGVIIVFFLFGVLLRQISNTFLQHPQAIGAIILYLITLLRIEPDQVSFRIWIFTVVPTIVFMVATKLLTNRG